MIRSKRLLAPKYCLVTGAANGIGLALCRRLANSGSVIVAIDNEAKALAELAQTFPKNIVPIEADLSDQIQVSKIIDQISDMVHQHGKLQIAVMNAAISATGPFEKLDRRVIEKIIALNARAPMVLASQLVSIELMDRGSSLIFMSSLSHKTGYPGAAAYGASKDALAIYAKSIRADFAKHKVNVLSVFPGPVNTQMAARHAPTGSSEKGRMDPEKLVEQILRAAVRGNGKLYPGMFAKLAAAAGGIFPKTMTSMMRRLIFERLPERE